MSKRLNEIEMFAGMSDLLESLHARGYKLFIMSSNSTSNISKFLSSNGVKKYFKKIYGGVGLLNKAGALRRTLKRNNLNPEDVIYVGDEVRDIEAAKDVDIKIVSVSWGFNDKTILNNEKPNFLVNTPAELLKILENLENR
jgi:phosphoglycolate phosphatase